MEKSMPKKFFILTGVVVLLIAIGFFWNARVACYNLPTVAEVQRVLTEHKDVIKELEGLSDTNSISFSANNSRCSDKAEIFITYGTVSDRKQIKERIGENFFGIPYRMFNT